MSKRKNIGEGGLKHIWQKVFELISIITGNVNVAEKGNLQEQIDSHNGNKSNPHGVTKQQIGLGNVDNTSDTTKPVSAAQQKAIDAVYAQAIAYADKVVANLINGAPTTLDTLGEIADAMKQNEDVVNALNAAIGSKANQNEFDSHVNNGNIHTSTSEKNKWNGYESQISSLNDNLTKNSQSISGLNSDLDSKITSSEAGSFATLADYWTEFDRITTWNRQIASIRFKDTGGWTDTGQKTWFRSIAFSQNRLKNGNYTVAGTILLLGDNSNTIFSIGIVSGGAAGTSDLTVTWQKPFTNRDIVPVLNGGTGQNNSVGILKYTLCNDQSNSSPEYVLGFNKNYAGCGYTSLSDLKTAMGLNNVNNTADSTKSVNYANSTGIAAYLKTGSDNHNRLMVRPYTGTPNENQQQIFLQMDCTNNCVIVGIDGMGAVGVHLAKNADYADSAGSANSVAWGNITGKPSTYPVASHSHNYLPLTGGNLNGNVLFNGYGLLQDWKLTKGTIGWRSMSTGASLNLAYTKSGSSSWTSTVITAEPTSDGNDATISFPKGLKLGPHHRTIYSDANNVNMWISTNNSYVTDNGIAGTYRFSQNIFMAGKDNNSSLGHGSYRWTQVYAASTSISSSDRNLKDNINELTNVHKQLFTKLIPVSFTFKDGTSGRTHIGFISQDVEQAMTECGLTDLDFAGFCKDIKMKCIFKTEPIIDENGNQIFDETGNPLSREIEEDVPDLDENGKEQYIYSLRYEEFIGIITYVLQDTIQRVNIIEERLAKIEI